jgi:hypothetical protein
MAKRTAAAVNVGGITKSFAHPDLSGYIGLSLDMLHREEVSALRDVLGSATHVFKSERSAEVDYLIAGPISRAKAWHPALDFLPASRSDKPCDYTVACVKLLEYIGQHGSKSPSTDTWIGAHDLFEYVLLLTDAFIAADRIKCLAIGDARPPAKFVAYKSVNQMNGCVVNF